MTVLVVDDERSVAAGIMRYMELDGIESAWASDGEDALRALQQHVFDAIVTDLRMPRMGGMELLARCRDLGLGVPVLFVSAYGEIEDAVQALKLGAADFLKKPFAPDELIVRIRRAIEDRSLRESSEFGKSLSRTIIFGESKSVRDIRALVDAVGPTNSTVLITGESGTGKEVIARAIHAASGSPQAPFVAVNLGGLPEHLAESELFGYERGAFTGAFARKTGLMEAAGEGTIFLDEIGEMSAQLQVKLLRVLQDRRLMRLGGTGTIPLRARFVAATNRDLEQEVREGRFREDLYYRINIVRAMLPPLRERKEDIPVLAGAAIAKIAGRMGRPVPSLSLDALRKLHAYDFPGNVRELENILERALIFARGHDIESDDIDVPSQRSSTAVRVATTPRTLQAIEAAAVESALNRWDGNRNRAAEELGIARRTIFDLIRRYGITIPPERADRS